MTENHFFISYPINKFWIAHIYEQMLAFELTYHKINWNTGNIGTGYIYLNFDQKISKDEFLDLISIQNFSDQLILKSWNIVRDETINNLDSKPAFELSQFRSSTINEIKKLIQVPPTIRLMKEFIDLIIEKSEKVLIINNKLVFNDKFKTKNPVLEKSIPFLIDRNNITQISFNTDAKNALEGYYFEIIGNNILKAIQKSSTKKVRFLSFQTAKKELYLSFIVPKNFDESIIFNALKYYEGYVFESPFRVKDDLYSQVNQKFQYFDWGTVLDPQYIEEQLKKVQIKYRILENSIILD